VKAARVKESAFSMECEVCIPTLHSAGTDCLVQNSYSRLSIL
jgi:hypothetical protein